MYDINTAFDYLFNDIIEKSNKGVKKVGNPAYKKTVNNQGKVIYVLVNKDEHPKAERQLTSEQFHLSLTTGEVEQHYDKVPVVRSLSDLHGITFLSDSSKGIIERCLGRIEFYKKSIAFAKATKNGKLEKAHQQSLDSNLLMIDNEVNRAYNRVHSTDLVSEAVIEDLKGLGISISGDNEESLDYINKQYKGFDLHKLCSSTLEAVEKQKLILEKQGFNTSQFKPKMSVRLFRSGFSITLDNPEISVENKYGWKAHLGIRMNREFTNSSTANKVYHAIFVLGDGSTQEGYINPLRGGLAKTLMQNFYEQYRNSGVNNIAVSAAGQGYGVPYCGSNTWGRWGFRVTKSQWQSMLNAYKAKFSETGSFETVDEKVIRHKEKEEIYEWKKNENSSFSKIPYEKGDFTEKDGRKGKRKITTKEAEDGTFESKILTSIKIDRNDVNLMESLITKHLNENPNEDRIPLVKIFRGMRNDVVRGIMKEVGWSGNIMLDNANERDDFEKNLFKKYDRIPVEQLEAKVQENKKLGKESDEIDLNNV